MDTKKNTDVNLRPELSTARLRNQFSVFLVFIIASAFIWLVIKLSNDFTSTVTYQVNYEDTPTGQILISASDSVISVGLDASGFDLVNYHLFKRKPGVTIDLSGVKIHSTGNVNKGFLVTEELIRKLSGQVGSHNELLFIIPDTLNFVFMPEHKKKVPVVPMVQYRLKPQHMLYDSIQISPDSIWLYGPDEILDTMFYVQTASTNLVDLHENTSVLLPLVKPTGVPLTYSATEVEVLLKIEKFTEKTFSLPVQIDCPKDEYTLRIFPETVNVHCLVALKDYKRVDPAMFKAIVECRNDDQQTSNKLRVEISQFPSFVRIARLEPERVEFIRVKTTQ